MTSACMDTVQDAAAMQGQLCSAHTSIAKLDSQLKSQGASLDHLRAQMQVREQEQDRLTKTLVAEAGLSVKALAIQVLLHFTNIL